MIPQVVYALAKLAAAGAKAILGPGNSGGSGSAAGGSGKRLGEPSSDGRFWLHAIHPSQVEEFAAAVPGAACAEECCRVLRSRGYHAAAESLERDILRLKRRYPGCLVAVEG